MFVRFATWPVALALLLASPGIAQDNDYARSGLYGGFAYSHGFAFFDDLPAADSSSGFTAVAGYRVSPFWSAELDLEYMNAFDLQTSSSAKVRTLSTTVNFNLYALEGRIQPYVKFGGGFGWAQIGVSSNSKVGGVLTIGIGGDYYLTRSIVLNLESMYVGNLGGIHGTSHLNVTVGARYRF